jgi:hypothetical protein
MTAVSTDVSSAENVEMVVAQPFQNPFHEISRQKI